jgi:predicted secreted hydrolase
MKAFKNNFKPHLNPANAQESRSVWTASALVALSSGRNLTSHQPSRCASKAAVNRPQSRRFATTGYIRSNLFLKICWRFGNKDRRTGFLALAAVLFFGVAIATETPSLTSDGFAIPQAARQFVFPRDYGSHPEFAIEWWYVTGHLVATNQAQFGFQATFFRRALVTPDATNNSSSTAFGNDQIYLAHMALVDKTSGQFRYEEKLNRAGWDAASSTNTLDVRNGNWSLRLSPEKSGATSREVFELQATVGAEVAFVLDLSPKKPLVVFGTNGVSRKAADFKASSHYLTYPRLAAAGTLTLNETNFAVTGEAWMDHEFSSSQLGAGQVGWDWLSLQLFDGRELMAYRMRRSDGTTDPFSTVAWIDAQSIVRHIGPEDFKWTASQHWRSRKTGAEYPSQVKLEAKNLFTGKPETFIVQPFVADQELIGKVGGVAYWEGACRVLDENKKEIGRAYMELTGYGESLKGKF